MNEKKDKLIKERTVSRRSLLKGMAAGTAAIALPNTSDASVWDAFFQKHFREMNAKEVIQFLNAWSVSIPKNTKCLSMLRQTRLYLE